jgi:hypothetical protein
MRKKDGGRSRKRAQHTGAMAGSSTEDHQRHLRETYEKIDAALKQGKLAAGQKRVYRKSICKIVDELSPAALARLHQLAREYKFYESHEALTEAIKEKYPKATIKAGKVLKGMFDKDGTVHLNGGGKLHGRPAKLEEFQAHEIAHAIDGHRELSGSAEWRQAWLAEIADGGYLGRNSARSAHEGWGDFGMLVLGTDISQNEIQTVMPRALAFWRKRGLL